MAFKGKICLLQNMQPDDGDVIIWAMLSKIIDKRKDITVSKMLSALPAA